MTGRRKFDELRAKMTPERRAQNEAATKAMLAETADSDATAEAKESPKTRGNTDASPETDASRATEPAIGEIQRSRCHFCGFELEVRSASSMSLAHRFGDGRAACNGCAELADVEALILADVEHRWTNAATVAALQGVRCTGSPSFAVGQACENWGAVCVILRGRLWAVPCREHANEVTNYPLIRGYGALRTTSLAGMVDGHGASFAKSAAFIRDHNIKHGIQLAAGEYFDRKKGHR